MTNTKLHGRRTEAEVREQVKQGHPWVKEWSEGICPNCVDAPTGSVVEDLYDGICRYCQCEEERPTDPAELPPSLRASTAEWRAWMWRNGCPALPEEESGDRKWVN
jgi:hypothetical protein